MNDIHGGNISGRKILYDFSANLNPLGMPESVKKAAVSAISGSDRYPDPYCRELIGKLSRYEDLPAENIVCGNGADDLIYRTIHALSPKNALIAAPTFSEYGKALSEAGCVIGEYPPEHICEAPSDSTDMIILCNPNNPTGRLYDRESLKILCEKCIETGAVFLCDECFIDLCGNAETRSVRPFMNKNVIILKAFTKTYAMAGLRLGYALFGSTELAGRVRGSGQFWSVSVPAQAAGTAALDEKEYLKSAVSLISDERGYLAGMLAAHGFDVIPSDANFILFRCGIPLDELLLEKGILIRNCSNYSGLELGWFRIAVRTHAENEVLAAAIDEITNKR